MKQFLAAVSALSLLISPVFAGNCPPVFVSGHHHHRVVLQQAVAYAPVVQYQVGAQVQAEAVIAKAVNPLKAEIAALRAQLAQGLTTVTTTTQTQGGATASVQGSQPPTIYARCAKCHTGESAKGEFRVDALELSCEDRLRAINALLADDPAKRMPKGGTLEAQELGELIQAFSGGR